MNLTEKIDGDYRNWKPGDVILITAPTGTGKSYFVQHELLKYIVEGEGKILYLVNRKILKDQLKEELNSVLYEMREEIPEVYDLEEYIVYETYQHIEYLICQKGWKSIHQLVEKCNVVVCDECHYFYADSSFNPKTELSYNCIRQLFDNKIQIYMSATMDMIKSVIKKDCLQKSVIPHVEATYGLYKLERTKEKECIIENYDIEKEYDYVNEHLIKEESDLVSEIIGSENTKDKWLIFIDSIEKGEKLKRDLIKGKIDKDDIVVVDAGYKNDEDAEENVEEIVNNKLMMKKIIITTPVMDNGISIHDNGLKNIVIMTDMKESFIQMLGRKRERANDEIIELYLMKRDIQYFKSRLNYVEKILKIYIEHKDFFKEERKVMLWTCNKKGQYLGFVKEVMEFPGFSDMKLGCGYNIGTLDYIFMQNPSKKDATPFIDRIMTNPDFYRKVRCFTYILNSKFYANPFSVAQLTNQAGFYRKMIKEIEVDEYAFYKEQCKWLGHPKTKENIIDDTQGVRAKKRKELIKALKALVGRKMSYDENKAEKNIYREWLKPLIEEAISFNEELEDINMDPLDKTSTNMTSEHFNQYMDIINIPFKMSQWREEGKNIYLIEEK